jgi:hypothetical protein
MWSEGSTDESRSLMSRASSSTRSPNSKGFLYVASHARCTGKDRQDFIGNEAAAIGHCSCFLIWTTLYILFLYWTEAVFGKNTAIDYREYFGPDACAFCDQPPERRADRRDAVSDILSVAARHASNYHYFESMVATIYALGTVMLLQFLFRSARSSSTKQPARRSICNCPTSSRWGTSRGSSLISSDCFR